MSSNLVKIRSPKWQFDAIGSAPRWDGPTFEARQFEPNSRIVTRGPVQPDNAQVIVAMNDETRLHRSDCFHHMFYGAVVAALVPFALASEMTGSVAGALMLTLFSAWLFRRGWRNLNRMSDALLDQGRWIGIYEGRVDLRKHIEKEIW